MRTKLLAAIVPAILAAFVVQASGAADLGAASKTKLPKPCREALDAADSLADAVNGVGTAVGPVTTAATPLLLPGGPGDTAVARGDLAGYAGLVKALTTALQNSLPAVQSIQAPTQLYGQAVVKCRRVAR